MRCHCNKSVYNLPNVDVRQIKCSCIYWLIFKINGIYTDTFRSVTSGNPRRDSITAGDSVTHRVLLSVPIRDECAITKPAPGEGLRNSNQKLRVGEPPAAPPSILHSMENRLFRSARPVFKPRLYSPSLEKIHRTSKFPIICILHF